MQQQNGLKLHECHVIFGEAAVTTYEQGELSIPILNGIGRVKYYQFTTLAELNAFLFGISEAASETDVLPVDDLEGG